MKPLLLIIIFPIGLFAQQQSPKDVSRWEKQAKNVTIIRDSFGVPHIYGKTNADAVFGLMYAQCEDDFKRVEMNYIEKLGRLSEVKGVASLYDDLLMRMVIDSTDAIADYKNSPFWLTVIVVLPSALSRLTVSTTAVFTSCPGVSANNCSEPMSTG